VATRAAQALGGPTVVTPVTPAIDQAEPSAAPGARRPIVPWIVACAGLLVGLAAVAFAITSRTTPNTPSVYSDPLPQTPATTATPADSTEPATSASTAGAAVPSARVAPTRPRVRPSSSPAQRPATPATNNGPQQGPPPSKQVDPAFL